MDSKVFLTRVGEFKQTTQKFHRIFFNAANHMVYGYILTSQISAVLKCGILEVKPAQLLTKNLRLSDKKKHNEYH